MKNTKLFGTNGIRFILNVDFDLDFVSKISQILGVFFKKGPILVGYDGRNTSKLLSNVVSNNLNKMSINLKDQVQTSYLTLEVNVIYYEN